MKCLIYSILIALVCAGCGKKDELFPEKSTLLLPAQNSVCITGTVTSATQSIVTFNWLVTKNTDTYEISIKNLLTSTIISQAVATNQAQISLLRNTPYSWYVVSKLATVAVFAQSDSWKFYNSGPGVVTYAPFPADVTSPTYDQNILATTTSVSLSWKGASTDNNIIGYDVYFGTTTTPALLKNNVTDMFLNYVSITSGTTYYWKVVTRDANGNTSDSGISRFKVN